ncbi:MAG TPA: general secretion pathway protein GspK [Deltaproteobacteria bacterium]|nr:general secretion pathway protein GspK [Deltaproteobacteria bacterium]
MRAPVRMKRPGDERGIALVLVVLVMTLIVSVTLRFNASSRTRVYEAANTGDGIILEHVSKSCIAVGRYVLKEEDGDVVSLRDDWARAGEVSLQSAAAFGIGHCEVRVVDESGKIPLNMLVDENGVVEVWHDVLERFFSLPLFGLSEQEACDIVDAVTDWIDEDDDITGFGAERGYYRGLASPCDCKNGPLDTIDELLLVKGVTEDLFHGRDDVPGIREFLTVHETGGVNINTAPQPVLQALSPRITAGMADDMDRYRRDENNDLSASSWYRRVPGMSDVTIEAELVRVRSDVFSIESTGRLDSMIRRITAVVKRERPGDMPVILSWTVD